MPEQIVTYEPDNSLKKGYFRIFVEIVKELWESRFLTVQLFKRDFLGMYKQSFVGVFWTLVMPLVSVGTFIILNNSGIFNIGEIDIPYPLYALLGIAFWRVFATGLNISTSSLMKAGAMLTKINFSKKALVIASIGRPLVIFLIQLVLLGILFVVYRIVPSIYALLIPVIIIPFILLAIGLGFLLSLFNAFVKDIGHTLVILTTFLMFLTPVLYAKPRIGILTSITKYNPLYYMVSAARDLVLNGTISEPRGFLISSIASVVVFVVCLFVFHLTETRITERI